MDVHQWKEWIQERSVGMTSPERIQCGLLLEVLHELRMIREATEQANDPDPDAEPDPFQTLNGPVRPAMPAGRSVSEWSDPK